MKSKQTIERAKPAKAIDLGALQDRLVMARKWADGALRCLGRFCG